MHQDKTSRQDNNNHREVVENKFSQVEINRHIDIKISELKSDIAHRQFTLERTRNIVNNHAQSIERNRQDTNQVFASNENKIYQAARKGIDARNLVQSLDTELHNVQRRLNIVREQVRSLDI